MSKLSHLLSGLSELFKFDNPVALFVNRLFFRKQGLTVYRCKGMDILIDHDGGDQHGTRACLTGDMYSRYFKWLPRDRPLRVLDLGANGGGLALSLAAEGFKLGQLACVEMNPNTFLRLHFNIHRNLGFSGIRLLNAAAYKEDGEIVVSLGKGSTADSIYGGGSSGHSATLPTKTLNTIIDESLGSGDIDLCKIDIEGAEYDLFQGPCDQLAQAKLLVIEIHPHATHTPESLVSRIKQLGFNELQESCTTDGTCAVHVFQRN
ncbi:MAG: FkbM family methyltransferase [Verrucomicrobiaceae bacterium]|nr:FkbM family methyltransferase [Verrucomicrobiaceae bacterium]